MERESSLLEIIDIIDDENTLLGFDPFNHFSKFHY
jgi:hypothetical protein